MTDYLPGSYLWRRARTVWVGGVGCKVRRGVSAMLSGLEKEAGSQSTPRHNPSHRRQSGRGPGATKTLSLLASTHNK